MAADGAGEPAVVAAEAGAPDQTRAVVAEAFGAGLFTFIFVAAGILGERFAIHNVGLALLITVLAGSAAFFVLARTLGSMALGFFNPGLTLVLALRGQSPLSGALILAAAQIGAAVLGAMLAHMVTNTGLVQVATQIETGAGVWAGEFIGTALFAFALLATGGRSAEKLPLTGALALLAVALATPSISAANPAVTLARAVTDSFTAIRLEDAAVVAGIQLAACIAAWLAHRFLTGSR